MENIFSVEMVQYRAPLVTLQVRGVQLLLKKYTQLVRSIEYVCLHAGAFIPPLELSVLRLQLLSSLKSAA